MSNHLFKNLHKNLRYAPLREVPSEPLMETSNENSSPEELSNEAILPVVLSSLYRYSLSSKGAEKILLSSISIDWISIIFGDRKTDIIERIAGYAHQTSEEILIKLLAVTEEAIRVLRKQVTNNGTIEDVRNALAESLDDSLFRLPIFIQLDGLLKECSPANYSPAMTSSAPPLTNAEKISFLNSGREENSPFDQTFQSYP